MAPAADTHATHLLERLEALLPRYLGAGPRYTSYPTAPVWSEAYGRDDLRRDLELVDPAAGLSVYVHVPFCRSLCHFCACNRTITRKSEPPARYLAAIEHEVETLHASLPAGVRARQLHWGGGTPTHLDPHQVRRLFRALVAAFPLRDGAEVSVEIDPRVTGESHFEALAECGFNRVSLGVQDFDPRVQQAVHRIQPVAETSRAVERARGSGFASVAFDLIYGLPFQTPDSFGRTLDTAIELEPDRIALYSYAHVTWVARQQRGFERKDLPSPAVKLRLMLLAIRRFLEAGYVYVGMDHFARPDDELARALRDGTLRRNFMGYTTQAGVSLLGLGPSAISELEASYAQSQRDLSAWERAVTAGELATLRGHRLSDDDRARRWIIWRVMCQGALRASDHDARFGGTFAQRYPAELERLQVMAGDGLLEIEADGTFRLELPGRILSRNVAAAFDAYLPGQQQSDRPIFSRTV